MKAVAMMAMPTLSHNQKQYLKFALISLLIVGIWMFAQDINAATVADEFQGATNKVEGWVKGNLGKLGALLALGIGSIMAGIKKDWMYFFGGLFIAVGVGVVAGIITASFGATLAF